MKTTLLKLLTVLAISVNVQAQTASPSAPVPPIETTAEVKQPTEKDLLRAKLMNESVKCWSAAVTDEQASTLAVLVRMGESNVYAQRTAHRLLNETFAEASECHVGLHQLSAQEQGVVNQTIYNLLGSTEPSVY